MKNRILGAVVLAFGLLLPNDALPQLENPPGPLPGPSDPEVRLPGGKLQKEEILKADHEKSVKDAAQLIDLAESLKAELEKDDTHVLSLSSLKKTEEIEKLAKRIRTRLKRF
ncbi:MAG: hypothetical protein DMG57_40300 [Acidobacteria bacterium]|nr:MAG: hypothetical protein DMG57_40300 [Acidobacteriota bacterium]